MKTICYDIGQQLETWNKINSKIGLSSIGHPDIYLHMLKPNIYHKITSDLNIKFVWDYDKIRANNPYAMEFLAWMYEQKLIDTWYPVINCIRDLITPSSLRSLKQHNDGFYHLFMLIEQLPYENKDFIYDSIYEYCVPYMNHQQITMVTPIIQRKNHQLLFVKNMHHDHTNSLLHVLRGFSFEEYFFWWHQQNFLTQERHVRMWGHNPHKEFNDLFNSPIHFQRKELLLTWLKNNHPEWLSNNPTWISLFDEQFWNEVHAVSYAIYLHILNQQNLLTLEDQQSLFYPMLASLTHEYEPPLFIQSQNIIAMIEESYPDLYHRISTQTLISLQNKIEHVKNPQNIYFFKTAILKEKMNNC